MEIQGFLNSQNDLKKEADSHMIQKLTTKIYKLK